MLITFLEISAVAPSPTIGILQIARFEEIWKDIRGQEVTKLLRK